MAYKIPSKIWKELKKEKKFMKKVNKTRKKFGFKPL